jgi:hypothetical protein
MIHWLDEGKSGLDRRKEENRLKRIARESREQEEGRIQRWLDLAKKFFDKDRADDPPASDA